MNIQRETESKERLHDHPNYMNGGMTRGFVFGTSKKAMDLVVCAKPMAFPPIEKRDSMAHSIVDSSRHEAGDDHFLVKKLKRLEDRFSMFKAELSALNEIVVLDSGMLSIGSFEVRPGVERISPSVNKGIYEHFGFTVFDKDGVNFLKGKLSGYKIPDASELKLIFDALPGKELFEHGVAASELFSLPKIGLRKGSFLKRALGFNKDNSSYLRTSDGNIGYVITGRSIEKIELEDTDACPLLLIKSATQS